MDQAVVLLKKEAIGIISSEFGGETAKLFAQFCEEKPSKEVLLFLRDLLKDFLGEKKAFDVILDLSERYNIKNL